MPVSERVLLLLPTKFGQLGNTEQSAPLVRPPAALAQGTAFPSLGQAGTVGACSKGGGDGGVERGGNCANFL